MNNMCLQSSASSARFSLCPQCTDYIKHIWETSQLWENAQRKYASIMYTLPM